MRRDDKQGAELRRPFRLGPEQAELGVLCVHGFTGTPFVMRLLGEQLAAHGLVAMGPQLAGHCGSTADLAASRWPDWLASVERAFDELRARCDRVAVCGLSLGGLLTLELARRRPSQIAAIAVLSAPLWLSPLAERAIRTAHRSAWVRRAVVPRLGGSDLADPEMRRLNNLAQGRGGIPLAALLSLRELMDQVRSGLPQVLAPALLAHSRRDHTAPFECMAAIAAGLGSPPATVASLPLDRSYHVLPLDLERERVFAAVIDHLNTHVPGALHSAH